MPLNKAMRSTAVKYFTILGFCAIVFLLAYGFHMVIEKDRQQEEIEQKEREQEILRIEAAKKQVAEMNAMVQQINAAMSERIEAQEKLLGTMNANTKDVNEATSRVQRFIQDRQTENNK